jgi:hypothetical protein
VILCRYGRAYEYTRTSDSSEVKNVLEYSSVGCAREERREDELRKCVSVRVMGRRVRVSE